MVDYKWWKEGSIYQIWPASFKDSNGDGVGDLKGIISKLDYIKDLGADMIWISPMYDSPQEDMGYDISDYNAIYPKYGTLEDMDTIIAEVHKRGMRLLLDLVVNHTSVEHKWFQESSSSKDNPKRDWYVWKPPRYNEKGERLPPNNWSSYFSQSAWQYDDTTGEYYLHLFAERQPDLNWESEACRQAIYKSALSFWFEKGIDGFRIDTAGIYSKDQSFPDAPIVIPDSDIQPGGKYFQNGPRIHEFHKEMFKTVTSKYDAMTVGEVGHSGKEEALKYVGASRNELNMMFLFNVVDLGSNPNDKFDYLGFDLVDFKKAILYQESFIEGNDGWTTVFYENHDQARSISRFGNDSDQYLFKSGKLLALLETALTGTLFIYQGQEFGMTNAPKDWSIDEYLDVNTINYYNRLKSLGASASQISKFKKAVDLVARDHARTPVQWDSSDFGGFSTAKPWMRVNDNYKKINAASQIDDPESLLSFWKKCLKLRKEYKDLFVYGSFAILDMDNKDIFTFTKKINGSTVYAVLNFTDKEVKFAPLIEGKLSLINSNVDTIGDKLTPYEGRIYKLE